MTYDIREAINYRLGETILFHLIPVGRIVYILESTSFTSARI